MSSLVSSARRGLFDEEHEQFRHAVRGFLAEHVEGNVDQWERDGIVPRDVFTAAGRAGLFGIAAPAAFGGGETHDYRFRCIIMEEIARLNSASLQSGFALQDDVFLPYLIDLASPEQQQRWLPDACAGTSIGAVAMTEPGAGSDLRGIATTARRDGDDWILTGTKTFITNGVNADLVVVVARTGEDQQGRARFSLFVVEGGTPGFERGRKLDKLGMHAQDTAELFFDECRIPASNLLGERDAGLRHLMERLPLERLSIAMAAVAAAREAFGWTVDHVRERQAFGGVLADQQTVQFTLAEMATELDVTQVYLDASVLAYNAGTLSAIDGAKCKWWATETQKRVVDRCLQLHGGYGYMEEYPIARAFRDARVQTIYGGATEVMKLLIGREIARPS